MPVRTFYNGVFHTLHGVLHILLLSPGYKYFQVSPECNTIPIINPLKALLKPVSINANSIGFNCDHVGGA